MSIIILVLFQAILYPAAFFISGFAKKTEANAMDILGERVETCKVYMEREMIYRWSRLSASEEAIQALVDGVITENEASYEDIKTDAQLNQAVLFAVAEEVLSLLRQNAVTSAFIVLDGNAVATNANTEEKAAIYLRDMDPTSQPKSNEDVYLERGPAEISSMLGVTIDNYWTPYFTIQSQEANTGHDFFYKPITAVKAKSAGSKAVAEDFGYWSPNFILNRQDSIKALTYTIPLLAPDGKPYGVLGIGMAHSYIDSLLDYQDLLEENTGVYMMGLLQENSFTPVFINGASYKDYYTDYSSISLTRREEDIYELTPVKAVAAPLWASVQNYQLYSSNSPYAEDNWVLMGAINKNKLLEFSHSLVKLLIALTVIVIVTGLGIAILTSKILVQPVIELVQELRQSNPNSKIRLKKTGIEEIDKLTHAIETMSESVAESASKISQIVELTGTSFGVFEMNREKNTVFCSEGLLQLLGWEDVVLKNSCMPVLLFEKKIDSLSVYYYDYTSHIYRLPHKQTGFRWIRINTTQTSDVYIGTVTDISREMNEKLKMEYDNSYDSLTDVMNRRAFKENLEELFEKPQHLGVACMVMWDLDNLKYVNDNFGHVYGDQYICALANCLKEFIYYNGFVCRRSGDEFLTFLYGYSTKEEVEVVLDTVWQRICQATVALPDNTKLKVRVSAGVAWYPQDTQNLADLQRYADFAMYDGKHNKKGVLMYFNQELYKDNSLLINGAEKLNQLIEEKLVRFAMQPIVSVKDAGIYGYEMLMRPQMPEFKSPMDVLRIARTQSKLYQIERLTYFEGLRTFSNQMKDRSDAHTFKIFVNSIANESFSVLDFEELEKEFGAYLPQVVMELTESEPLNTALTKTKRAFIRKYNGLIALDDYGSGYNSESTLLFVAPDIIKLDMELVRNVNIDTRKQTLISNIVSYAKSRGILVLAEGVESYSEMYSLIELGADYLQGYYIGKPAFAPTELDKNVAEEISYAYEQQNLQGENLF
ncbi:MAG: GGDEF and EAL domain-containing protein [Oscillospiraceae bacterium]|nr:GGDEF and EAL domain-containing protein [Oscillospiraceae bacterium]